MYYETTSKVKENRPSMMVLCTILPLRTTNAAHHCEEKEHDDEPWYFV